MIFVTVGTHEQPFNRLVEEIDKLKGDGVIKEDVIIQKGYSTYVPKYCECYDLLPYDKMQQYNRDARIIITHGGPASFIDILALGKTPIIVPRQAKYNEHVNNHQLEFCKELKKRDFPIIYVEDILKLQDVIKEFDNLSLAEFKSNNLKFNEGIINFLKGECK